jgi:hypothetical protein
MVVFDLDQVGIDPCTPIGPTECPNFELVLSRPAIEGGDHNVSHDDSQ